MFFFFPSKPAPSGGIVIPGTAAWTLAVQALSATGAVTTTPATMPGLVAWYRADLGITLGTGQLVASWADQSGNGYTATQATGANQLTLLPTGGPNGQAALSGNNAAGTFMTASIGTLTKPSWAWMVFKFTSTSTTYALDGGSVNTMAVINVASTSVHINSGTVLPATATMSSFGAFGFAFGSSGSVAENGSVISSGTTGTNSATGLTIGGAGNFAGFSADMILSELVITSVVPSSANVLSAYSQARYGFG